MPIRRDLVVDAVVVIGFFIVWELVADLHLVSALFFPPLSLVVEIFPFVVYHEIGSFFLTMSETVVAFLLAAAVGVSMGFVIGYSKFASQILEPYLNLGLAIPKILLYPLLIIWVGVNTHSTTSYGFINALFPIAIAVIVGIRGQDQAFVSLARSMGATRSQMFTKVLIPEIIPVMSAGLRVALKLTLTSVIAAELLFPTFGIGASVYIFSNTFRPAEAFASILFIAIAAMLINQVSLLIEARVSFWRHVEG